MEVCPAADITLVKPGSLVSFYSQRREKWLSKTAFLNLEIMSIP